MTEPLSHSFEIPLQQPASALWAVLVDTQRLNVSAGNPKFQIREELDDAGHVEVFGGLDIAGLKVEWLETTPNWIEGRWMTQRRVYTKGPLSELGATMTIVDDDEGLRCRVDLFATSSVWLVRTLVEHVIAKKTERALRAIVANAVRAPEDEVAAIPAQVRLSRAARARAMQFAERIESTPYGHGLAERLVDYVVESVEIDLWTIRPIALARMWGVEERAVIELCLQAVREGLLESRWDLLCPRCRVPKEQSLSMDSLPEGVHCTTCNIDYHLDFSTNVELAFSPGRSVRPVEFGFYCRSSPTDTPHIKCQITVPAGTEADYEANLPHGQYRVRTLESGGEVDVEWSAEEPPLIVVRDDQVTAVSSSEPGRLRIRNEGALERTVVVEHLAWRDDALTAARVMTLQAFRDLFSDQVLRPGDEVGIGAVTFMFTDLSGSTALFSQIGDAEAFAVVREHFELLSTLVRDHGGTIIKTLGDGLHAAFFEPKDALLAALDMHSTVRVAFADAPYDVGIRIGLHTGSSISVMINDRLDYYGSTVNMAARLEAQGEPGQITMSESFASDVAVAPVLGAYTQKRKIVDLKGFDRPVPIVQITT
jgi:class 3 adenylate cyclase